VNTTTRSFCDDCQWEDTSDVVSRADKHSREKSHITHTLTTPATKETREL
jgi:hypothetical protein